MVVVVGAVVAGGDWSGGGGGGGRKGVRTMTIATISAMLEFYRLDLFFLTAGSVVCSMTNMTLCCGAADRGQSG